MHPFPAALNKTRLCLVSALTQRQPEDGDRSGQYSQSRSVGSVASSVTSSGVTSGKSLNVSEAAFSAAK